MMSEPDSNTIDGTTRSATPMATKLDTLFPQPALPAAAPEAGPFAVVALEQAIDRVLDYSIPKKLSAVLQIGQRVRVRYGG